MRRRRTEGARAIAWSAGPWTFGLAAALLSGVSPDRLTAQSAPQLTNAGALFLLLPVGAAAAGMGQTAITLEGSGEAVFWNPAGLATLPASEFAVHTATFAAGPTNAVTLFFPRHGIGVFGGAVYLLDYGDQDVVDSSGVTIARIAPRNVEYLASFATQLPGGLSLGVTYKLIEFRVDCSGVCTGLPNGNGTTHAIDIGGQFAVGPEGALRFGVAVRNIGFKLQVNNNDQADPLPARIVFGAVYRVQLHAESSPAGRGLDAGAAVPAAPPDRLDLRVAADIDTPWDNSAPPEMRLGVDLGFRDVVRLRGGYAFTRQGIAGPSVGVGIASGSIGVDFARTFMTGSDLITANPTFVSFRLTF